MLEDLGPRLDHLLSLVRLQRRYLVAVGRHPAEISTLRPPERFGLDEPVMAPLGPPRSKSRGGPR